MKERYTDRERLDWLQRQTRRTETAVGFNGQVVTVPVDSRVIIRKGECYVAYCDRMGRSDPRCMRRSGGTVREAIDAAMNEERRARLAARRAS